MKITVETSEGKKYESHEGRCSPLCDLFNDCGHNEVYKCVADMCLFLNEIYWKEVNTKSLTEKQIDDIVDDAMQCDYDGDLGWEGQERILRKVINEAIKEINK